MTPQELERLKYPVGRANIFNQKDFEKDLLIKAIDNLPGQIINLTSGLSEMQLNKKHRPEGWTIRQIVHHVADSHLNSFVRFKWTLTEDEPRIKTYREAEWAKQPDTTHAPIELSHQLLTGLHARWVILLNSLSDSDFKKRLYHPEMDKFINLEEMVRLYAWHGEHHVAHIKNALSNDFS